MRHNTKLLYGSFFLFLGIALAAVALTPAVSIAQDDQEEAHKEVVRRIVEEGFNQGNVAVIDELVAEDYVSYSLGGVETEES